MTVVRAIDAKINGVVSATNKSDFDLDKTGKVESNTTTMNARTSFLTHEVMKDAKESKLMANAHSHNTALKKYDAKIHP